MAVHRRPGRDVPAGNIQVPIDAECRTFERLPDGLNLADLADLVANGKVGFPAHLTSDESQELLEAVRMRRHRRLVNFIARTIAHDILRSRAQSQGGN